MRAWSYKFKGRYPVGAVAVVIAGTKDAAVRRLQEKLKSEGFNDPVVLKDMQELDLGTPHAVILVDGEY